MASESWENIWDREVKNTTRQQLSRGDFWDQRVAEVCKGTVFGQELTDWQMAVVAPRQGDSCLEIGPGCGRLTLPLAVSVASVTVFDISAAMIGCLQKNAAVAGVGNICCINQAWEEALLPSTGYDLLLASFSLFMHGLDRQVRRMAAVAHRTVVFASGELRVPLELQQELYGKVVTSHTDAEMIAGVAAEAGLRIRCLSADFGRQCVYPSLGVAVDSLVECCGVGPEQQATVEDYVTCHYQTDGHRYWRQERGRVGAIEW